MHVVVDQEEIERDLMRTETELLEQLHGKTDKVVEGKL